MTDRPKRIQRRRVKGWRMPKGAVYVGRPTYFGNPFQGKTAGAEAAVERFRRWLDGEVMKDRARILLPSRRNAVLGSLEWLRGHDLACWCRLCERHRDGLPLGETCDDCAPCHGTILLELANADMKEASQ